MRKRLRRKVKAARQAARLALFFTDYYRHHGKLPEDMTRAALIKLRNRELARFAGARQSPQEP